MNTIDDLRATMRRHVDELDHRPDAARVAAVHQRVAVVRRQRRAAVAGAVAAVLVVVGGVSLLPDRSAPDPAAERRLAGHLAPRTIDSLGYTFTFDRGYEGDGRRRVTLDAADGPLIVSWASSAGDLTLRSNLDLDDDGSVPETVPAIGDFSDWLLLEPGETAWLEPRSRGGSVAVAVYTLAGRPDGLTKDGLTWRQQIPDGSLVSGVIGDLGQTEVTMEVTIPEDRVGFDSFCSTASSQGSGRVGPWVRFWVNGRPALGGHSCDRGIQAYDLSEGLLTTAKPGLVAGTRRFVAGDTVTVTARLVRDSSSGEPLQEAQARLAMAFYALDDADGDVIERAGHRWRLQGEDQVQQGRVSLVAPETVAPVLPMLSVSGPGQHEWRVYYGKQLVVTISLPNGGGAGLPVLQPWQAREIRLQRRDGLGREFRARVDYYVRVD